MADETVLFEVKDRIATITLNRPERLNAINRELRDTLRDAWQRVKTDPEIWCAVVTGAGRAFSSGADVETLDSKGFTPPDHWLQVVMQERIRVQPYPRRMGVHKPVIAAVNGLAGGVALDLVTEADIPIASERAEFLDPHVSIGYVSSHEMVNMARRVPVAYCLRMALLGTKERMSAEKAMQIGLVTEVVAHEQLLPRAHELARLVCENAPLAVWGTKMGILRGLGLPFEQADEIAAGYLKAVEGSEDHSEGTRAFVEKRKPRWQAK